MKAIIVLTMAVFAALGLSGQTPGDTVDVLKYDLHLDVLNLPAKVIHGKAGVEFCVKQPSVSVIPLELKQLQVDSIKSAEGTHMPFTRSGDMLHVYLSSAISPSDTTLLWIWYHGIPFAESWGGFHFSGSYAFNLGVGFTSIPHNLGKAWFPCVDDFKDRALYDYHIRVENANQAVCGGILQSVTSNLDGTHTYFWKTNQTLPTYLASVAVGQYALITDFFNGMEEGIPITYYVRPSDTSRVAGSFANLKDIASIYEFYFGPYPFSRIGITGTALGAMEHAENIAYPNSSITGNSEYEWLYAHELSHMWFGDKVTCASDADMWLNEGWARWCEIVFTDGLYGEAAADNYYRALLKEVLQYTHIRDNGYRALSPMDPQYTYGSTVYDKGALVTHTLRHYLGDSLFFNSVRDYLDQYAFNHADSYQLRDALSQSSGVDLTGFFDFFVFTPGFTHYSIDSSRTTQNNGEYDVTLFMKQKLRGTDIFMNDCRVEVSFMKPDNTFETKQISFSGQNDSATVSLSFEPLLILTDLYNHTADATTDQAKTLVNTGMADFEHTFFKLDVQQITDSAFVRITHNWVAPDSLWNPQPGLTLSSVHYWTVEGIFPDGFNATGIFSFNRSVFDSDIIDSSADSLVILYRPHPGENWQSVAFTKTGPWQIGNVYVENLKPGQYAYAGWDEQFVGYGYIPENEKMLKVFPNPSTEGIHIYTSHNRPAQLSIHQSDGIMVFQRQLAANESVHWKGSPGTYLISLSDRNKKIASVKAVITH